MFLAILDFIYAFALANPTPQSIQNPTTQFLIALMPLGALACIWGGVGIILLTCAFLKTDKIAFTCAIALKIFWSLVFGFGWLMGQVERGYLSAAIWAAFAAFVAIITGWQENWDRLNDHEH